MPAVQSWVSARGTETASVDMTETASALPGFAPERVAAGTVALQIPSPQAIPAVGVYMTPDHRYYLNGQGPVPSVTTVIGVLDKPAVVAWKARATADAIISNWPHVSKLIAEEGQDAAAKWGVREADKARDTAAALGTSVHRLADLIGTGGSDDGSEGFHIDTGTLPYVRAFQAFLARYGGSQSIVSSEKAVWSANGYAGTYDLLMQLPAQVEAGYTGDETELWLIDIKTSKAYYPEYGLQLAGYRWADSIVLPHTPVVYPMPQVQRTGVLHLRPDQYPDTGWRLIEYPTDHEKDYMTFLGALEIWRWQQAKRFTKSALTKAHKARETESGSLPL